VHGNEKKKHERLAGAFRGFAFRQPVDHTSNAVLGICTSRRQIKGKGLGGRGGKEIIIKIIIIK
jgi:hypothetical protein